MIRSKVWKITDDLHSIVRVASVMLLSIGAPPLHPLAIATFWETVRRERSSVVRGHDIADRQDYDALANWIRSL